MTADPRCDSVAIRPAADRARDEQHRDEQQPGTEEHGREEPVLGCADPIAYHAHEPQERKPGERNEIERDDHRVLAPGVVEPGGCIVRVCRDGDPHEHQGGAEQQCEHDARDGRSARRAQQVPGDRDVLCHRKPPIAKSIPSVRHRRMPQPHPVWVISLGRDPRNRPNRMKTTRPWCAIVEPDAAAGLAGATRPSRKEHDDERSRSHVISRSDGRRSPGWSTRRSTDRNPTATSSVIRRRPRGVPNVLLVLIDDAGFGNPQHVRRSDRHAELHPHLPGWRALQPVPRHRTLLADRRLRC